MTAQRDVHDPNREKGLLSKRRREYLHPHFTKLNVTCESDGRCGGSCVKVSKGFRDIEEKRDIKVERGVERVAITDREWSWGMIHMGGEPRDIPKCTEGK